MVRGSSVAGGGVEVFGFDDGDELDLAAADFAREEAVDVLGAFGVVAIDDAEGAKGTPCF